MGRIPTHLMNLEDEDETLGIYEEEPEDPDPPLALEKQFPYWKEIVPRSFTQRPLLKPYEAKLNYDWPTHKIDQYVFSGTYGPQRNGTLTELFPSLAKYERLATCMAEEHERETLRAQIAEELLGKNLGREGSISMDILPRLKHKFATQIEEVIRKDPELFTKDVEAVRKLFPKYATPFEKLYDLLRIKFWTAFREASENGSVITMETVFEGVCSRQLFMQTFMRNPIVMAYVLCPVVDHVVLASDALEQGMKEVFKMLELPNVLPNGKVDPVVVNLKVQIVKLMANRVYGAPVQKQMIQQHTHHTSTRFDEPKDVLATPGQGDPMLGIKQRMAELVEKERKALNLPDLAKEPREQVVEAEIVQKK